MEEERRGAVSRRQFLMCGAVAASGLLSVFAPRRSLGLFGANSAFPEEGRRPAKAKRKFASSYVDQIIDEVKASKTDPQLASLFENCFPNTLDTTVQRFYRKNGKPYTYLITGDIEAMWLRDSAFQVMPYIGVAKHDRQLQDLIAGVINQQTEFILRDPYANAFYDDVAKLSPHLTDNTDMRSGVYERKWEPDSLCAPIHLAFQYWQATGDGSFIEGQWVAAVKQVVRTFEQQQRLRDNGPYSFMRITLSRTEMVPNGGWGRDTKRIGLIHSTHRPSDDACEYPFNIPANLFAATALDELAEMFATHRLDLDFADACRQMSDTIIEAVSDYGIIDHPHWGRIYAYEIDGLGGTKMMDDANVPGLLSLPYLNKRYFDDPVYQNTRRFVLSSGNPYFHQGKFAHGIGSPHTEGDIPNGVWPMAIILGALTGEFFCASVAGQHRNPTGIKDLRTSLRSLMDIHAGTFVMHESTDPDHPQDFTRPWFAMANSLFGDLFLKVYKHSPELLGNLQA